MKMIVPCKNVNVIFILSRYNNYKKHTKALDRRLKVPSETLITSKEINFLFPLPL